MRRVRLFELVRSSSPICFGSLQTTTPDFRMLYIQDARMSQCDNIHPLGKISRLVDKSMYD
ncbi:hypothetical protein J6590_099781 [Homalodisca vitripennis]|nr:hypothetical protein J6590_099781 [Homalodisca vitripennis]